MRPHTARILFALHFFLCAPLVFGQVPTLTWDASQDLNGDALWPSVEDPARAWNLAAPATAEFGASEFPSAGVWFNSLSGTQASLDGLGGSTQSVSWELVFRPVDLNGNHVIFETGGNGDGTAFVLQGSVLEFRVQDAALPEQRIIATHTLAAGDEAKFHHVVAAVTLGAAGANRVDLFVNAGPAVASLGATGALLDWAGTDAAGLGRLNGGVPTGQTGFDAFAGDIALLRYYQSVVMTEAQVQAKFDDLSSGVLDSEPDGLPDFWEMQFFGDLNSDANDDNDADGLINGEELLVGTDPTETDTDGDSIDDADELNAVPPTSPTKADTDDDGLDDPVEITLGTNPTAADTDGDTFNDGLEVAHGFDPTNSAEPAAGTGPTVIWITENTDAADAPSPDDSGWTELLRLYGFVVERRDVRDLDTNQAALDEMNAADLVIVSRDTNSGNYSTTPAEVTAWNTTITKPLILLSPFIVRNNRWLWFNTTTIPLAGSEQIEVTDPGHPVFRGITLDGDNQFTIIDAEDVNLTGALDAGNGTVLATDPTNGNVWVSHWDAGVEFYTGSGQTTGGPRLWFGAGIVDNNPKGGENFTLEGEFAFLNAVDFILGNTGPGISIENIDYDQVNEEITLTWTSTDNATYGVFFSTDLINFDADVDDAVPSGGAITSFTFSHPSVGAPKLFFRVIEN